MFFKQAIRTIGEAIRNPQVLSTIGEVARGIRTGASKVNEATGGLLKQAIEALPMGKTALKVGEYALKGAEKLAGHLGRKFAGEQDGMK